VEWIDVSLIAPASTSVPSFGAKCRGFFERHGIDCASELASLDPNAYLDLGCLERAQA